MGCISLAKVTLPQSLGELGFYAFKGCTALQSITIPKSVMKCGGYCFKNSGLKTVTFENGMATVPAHMFADCGALQTINFPQTIKTIEDSAFVGCISLAKVILPQSLGELGFYAFKGCTALQSITIPKSVVKCGGYCFKNSGLKTVTFENGAVTVPAHMFADCETLQTINFPQTIKTIEDSAFVGCTALTKVTLPWYLESIGFYAFKGCTNLKDITIYQKVKSIDGYAFKNVTGLTIHGKKKTTAQTFAKEKGYSFATCKTPALKGITYKKGSLKYTVVSDYIGGKGTVCVTGLTKNTSSVTIPKTVQLESYKYKVVKINSKAFYKKSKLKKITIQSTTITSIGKNAFKGINKKAVIKVPKSKYSKYKKLLTSKTGFAKKTMKVKK